jgi:activator of HSP90 ATPase
MAKWGQGDPRWIVEDRPDAINVNNWHWAVKDATAWSTNKIMSLLSSISITTSETGSWTLTDIKSNGEASVSNRKGKLIVLYDWSITGKISGGNVTDGDEKDEGNSIEIRGFSFENDMEDIEFTIKHKILNNSAIEELKSKILDQLKEYISLLTKEFSQGLLLPTAQTSPSNPSVTSKPPVSSSSTNSDVTSSTVGIKISTKRIKILDTFKCECSDLYNVFVTEELVKAFTRANANINGQKGGQFSLYSGNIVGEYVQLERPNKIIKKWRSKEWPEGHFSTVTMEFIQEPDGTKLTLHQTGIPSTDYERTKEGWKRYIFEPIKTTFGYGARIF